MKTPDTTSPPADPILVVDDEKAVLTTLQQTLRRCHYDTLSASNPLIALEHLKKQSFSVIISDQVMPEMSGLELLARARQIQPHATRILITAVVNLGTVIEAINKGEIFRFIVKPWLHEEFLATIKNGVQRYELICQNARLQTATQAMNEQLVDLNRSLEQQVQLVAQQNRQLADVNIALERNFVRSMELCVHTMQTFYPSLGNQARRVCQLCKSIAQVLQLNDEERRVLESSALLHDIGLVGVPRQIIRRWQEDPCSLDPAETALIEQHPILGQELAAFGSDLKKVGEIIRAHHEHYDGSGYPDQLVGPAAGRGRGLRLLPADGCRRERKGENGLRFGLRSRGGADFSAGAEPGHNPTQRTAGGPGRIAAGHGFSPGHLHPQRPVAGAGRPAHERHVHRKSA